MKDKLEAQNIQEQHGKLRGFDKVKNVMKGEKMKKMSMKGNQMLKAIKKSDDPLKELGVGITSYHWLLTRLFALFLLLWLIHWPVIDIFMSYTEYKTSRHGSFGIYRSLGNMGFSAAECKIRAMRKTNVAKFKCHTGKIDSLVDWGVSSRSDVNQ